MRVIRANPEANFTKLTNLALRDQRLSYRARGLLGELLSYPDGWDTNVDKLVVAARRAGRQGEGREAMRKAMNELEHLGYVAHEKRRGERGQWITETWVTDDPELISDRRTGFRASADRASGNPPSADEASETRALSKKTITKTVTKIDEKREDKSSLSSSSGPDAEIERPPAEIRERDEPDSHPKNTPDPYSDRRPYLAAEGITDHEAQEQAIRQVELMNNVKSPGWWITAAKNGTLPARIEAAVEGLARQAEWAGMPHASPTTPSRPDWCGKCDHVTRTIDAPGGAAHAQIRCPACHPKSLERSAA